MSDPDTTDTPDPTIPHLIGGILRAYRAAWESLGGTPQAAGVLTAIQIASSAQWAAACGVSRADLVSAVEHAYDQVCLENLSKGAGDV